MRELENILERALAFANEGVIEVGDLSLKGARVGEERGLGAVAVGSKMVDPPVVRQRAGRLGVSKQLENSSIYRQYLQILGKRSTTGGSGIDLGGGFGGLVEGCEEVGEAFHEGSPSALSSAAVSVASRVSPSYSVSTISA